MQKIKTFIGAHKRASTLILIILSVMAYYGYKSVTAPPTETKYVLAAAEKGTVAASVSGSGQVSALQQVDAKSKVSGDVTGVNVKQGGAVKAGAILAQIDSSDAVKSLRDAEINLKSAKFSYEKFIKPATKLSLLQAGNSLAKAKRDLADLKKPPDALTLLQAENAVTDANEAKQQAEDDLEKAYDDGFTAVSNAFLDFPTVITGIESIFFTNSIERGYENINWYQNQVILDSIKAAKYRDDVYSAYRAARKHYDENFDSYKATTRTSDKATIEILISEAYDTAKLLSDTVKNGKNYVDFVQNDIQHRGTTTTTPAIITTHQNLLDGYTGDINTNLSSLLNAKNAIKNGMESIVGAERTIVEKTESLNNLKEGADANTIASAEEGVAEKTESLKNLKAGPDKLDIESQKLSLQQKENALADAREKLVDYSVRAPFDGIVAKVSVKKNDEISSGTAIATIITKQRIAEVTLNEVDIARVKVGQKVTLTFDAVDGLTISGEVFEVDSIGTVTQGVVNYTVKIVFDTQDERVKPGMSVSAAIITDIKQDVLYVPNAAIKLQGDVSYVEVFDQVYPTDQANQGVVSVVVPRRQTVELGIADDISTEIVSGIKEGDQVVTRTIKFTATPVAATPSLFGGGAAGGGAGGSRGMGGVIPR